MFGVVIDQDMRAEGKIGSKGINGRELAFTHTGAT